MVQRHAWWGGLVPVDRRARRRRNLLLLAVVAVGILVAVARLTPWQLLELRAFDYLSTIDPPKVRDDSPIIVAIDEPSLAEIGQQWPWPRDLHGRLISALREAGVRAIGLDIIFAEPSNPRSDAILAANLGSDVVLAGDETYVDDPHGLQFVRVEPLAEFSATGAVTGIASISPDGDGILRRVPSYGDGLARSLLTVAGRDAPEASDKLMQVLGPARTYRTVSYYQALDPAQFLPPDFLRDRVVMIGLSLQNAPTLDQKGSDAYATSATLRTGRLVPGVEIQATIYDNLAAGFAIDRAPPWLVALTVAAGSFLGFALVRRGTRWSTLFGAAAGLLVIAVGAFLALRFGRVFVPPLAPAAALVGVTAGQSILDYAAERRLRYGITRAFSQYISPALVSRLADNPDQLKLGGELRELTILFCDIRGFTTIAESMKDDPERLTTLINRLLTPLSDIVMARNGTIDKYIGDCLMAFWNAPLDDPDHALHAVESARAMMQAVAELNSELAAEAAGRGDLHLEMKVGIGINSGACVVGNMGSRQRFDYSALGDAVNLASRLESSSKDLGVPVVIGENTAKAIGDRLALRPLRPIMVKGRSAATMVFTLAEVEILPESAGQVASL